ARAQRCAELLAEGGGHFLLAHLAPEAAEVALDGSERPDFLAQGHCNSQYTYCRLRCQIARLYTRPCRDYHPAFAPPVARGRAFPFRARRSGGKAGGRPRRSFR